MTQASVPGWAGHQERADERRQRVEHDEEDRDRHVRGDPVPGCPEATTTGRPHGSAVTFMHSSARSGRARGTFRGRTLRKSYAGRQDPPFAGPGTRPAALPRRGPRGREMGGMDNAHQQHPAAATRPRPGRYVIDPASSAVTFRTRHMFGLAPVRGTFAIRAGAVEVTGGPARRAAHAEIDAASFRTGNPQRDASVRSARLLDTGRHPVIMFEASGWTRDGAGSAGHADRPRRSPGRSRLPVRRVPADTARARSACHGPARPVRLRPDRVRR